MNAMEQSQLKEKVDEDGYLINFEDWDEDVAYALARAEGIEELAKDKIDILHFMRDYYRKFNSFPILDAVCKNVHQPKNCTYEQFPDPIKAWKVAGLPKPTSEIFALVRHKIS